MFDEYHQKWLEFQTKKCQIRLVIVLRWIHQSRIARGLQFSKQTCIFWIFWNYSIKISHKTVTHPTEPQNMSFPLHNTIVNVPVFEFCFLSCFVFFLALSWWSVITLNYTACILYRIRFHEGGARLRVGLEAQLWSANAKFTFANVYGALWLLCAITLICHHIRCDISSGFDKLLPFFVWFCEVRARCEKISNSLCVCVCDVYRVLNNISFSKAITCTTGYTERKKLMVIRLVG